MKKPETWLIAVLIGLASLAVMCIWGCVPDYSFHDIDSALTKNHLKELK